jgi:hypothetical protein
LHEGKERLLTGREAGANGATGLAHVTSDLLAGHATSALAVAINSLA